MPHHALISQYAQTIRDLRLNQIKSPAVLPDSLEIRRSGGIATYYCPIDYNNPNAKLVIVGITPGFTQLWNALREAQEQLKAGKDHFDALKAAKRRGAFSGNMRPNLVSMLDHIKINEWLGISTCDSLFNQDTNLVQTTSILRFPVFINGKNYDGNTPNMVTHPFLKTQLSHFVDEMSVLPGAMILPLGGKVSSAIRYLVDKGQIDGRRVLDGLPHPSPASNERISYFLGRKDRALLSVKTNPDSIDAAKEALLSKVASLMAANENRPRSAKFN